MTQILEYCRIVRSERNNDINIIGITQKDVDADCGA